MKINDFMSPPWLPIKSQRLRRLKAGQTDQGYKAMQNGGKNGLRKKSLIVKYAQLHSQGLSSSGTN